MRKSVLIAGLAVVLALLAGELRAGKKGNGGGKPGGGDPPADPAIAYIDGHTLMVANADGSNVVVLVEGMGARRPSWSPDGTQIAFGAYLDDHRTPGIDVQGIYVVNADGTGLHEVIPHDDGYGPAVAWSPAPMADGRYKLVFTNNGVTSSGYAKTDLCLVNLDGTGFVNLTDFTGPSQTHEFWPAWSPAADRIAVLRTGTGLDTDLIVHEIGFVDGAPAITSTWNLTSEDDVPGGSLNDADLTGCMPAWAKTQDLIAVTSFSLRDIWVIDLSDPANPVNATGTPSVEERYSSFSPDDSDLAYWVPGTRKVDGIYLVSSGKIIKDGGALDWRRNP